MGRISFIRDYRYVGYAADDAELVLAPDDSTITPKLRMTSDAMSRTLTRSRSAHRQRPGRAAYRLYPIETNYGLTQVRAQSGVMEVQEIRPAPWGAPALIWRVVVQGMRRAVLER